MLSEMTELFDSKESGELKCRLPSTNIFFFCIKRFTSTIYSPELCLGSAMLAYTKSHDCPKLELNCDRNYPGKGSH